MRTNRVAQAPIACVATGIVAYCLLLGGCKKQADWPPQRLSAPPADFVPSTRADIKGVLSIFKDASKTELIGNAIVMRDARWAMGFNLFGIDKAGDGYVESQCEVVYYDDHETLVRADPQHNDSLALVEDDSSGANTWACTYPGAHVRYAGKMYELRHDGWYLDNRLVHAFVGATPVKK